FRMRLPRHVEYALWRQTGGPVGDDGFQALYRFLIRSTADVTRAVIVIVREYATDFTVLLDASGPVALILVQLPILLNLGELLLLALQSQVLLDVFLIERLTALVELLEFLSQRVELLLNILELGVRRLGRQRFAEIGFDPATIIAWVQACQHALAIRSHPDTHVERRAFRRLLARLRTS